VSGSCLILERIIQGAMVQYQDLCEPRTINDLGPHVRSRYPYKSRFLTVNGWRMHHVDEGQHLVTGSHFLQEDSGEEIGGLLVDFARRRLAR
jgi:hypothetical protein